jgi:hypothetical protein
MMLKKQAKSRYDRAYSKAYERAYSKAYDREYSRAYDRVYSQAYRKAISTLLERIRRVLKASSQKSI